MLITAVFAHGLKSHIRLLFLCSPHLAGVTQPAKKLEPAELHATSMHASHLRREAWARLVIRWCGKLMWRRGAQRCARCGWAAPAACATLSRARSRRASRHRLWPTSERACHSCTPSPSRPTMCVHPLFMRHWHRHMSASDAVTLMSLMPCVRSVLRCK